MRSSKSDQALGVDSVITRRDFVNGSLAVAGTLGLASLTAGCSPGATNAPDMPSGSSWTGFGGEGDYRWSNGNTEAVVEAAHGIRDGLYDEKTSGAEAEVYDVVVVGGGFSGLGAAYEFAANAKPGERLLILENHPIFGGEAKQNDIRVDDVTLTGPQGSNGSAVPKDDATDVFARIFGELGLPRHYDLLPLAGGAEKLSLSHDHYLPMLSEADFQTGYYFPDRGWLANPAAKGFAGTPWSPKARQDLTDFVSNSRDVISAQTDPERWLDTMSYQQLLEKMGYGPEVISFINPLIGVGNFGLAADAVSARAVQLISQPGTYPATEKSRWSGHPTGGSIAFPGGNAAIARAMVQRLFPGVIPGDARAALFPTQPMQLDGLDRPGSPVRMRLSSTVVRVEHDGDPASAGHVLITYAKDGKLHRIKAKSVVMGVGGWVSRRVVRDLPESHVEAYGKFNYGPVLTVNVAVRNWRFFSKLGFSSARWFNGFGWQVCVRRNMAEGGDPSPLTPDSPLMLTFYVPVQFPGESAAAQGALARQKIFETPFADYERQVRQQMTEMFGSAGFDAKRDIAGIVVNRWGHAFCAPAPGFFHGANGAPGARDIIRKPHGRVVFAHSELNGRMSMRFALNEGVRGGLEALEIARS